MKGGADENGEAETRKERMRYIFVGNKARKSLTHQLRPLGKVELFYDGFMSTLLTILRFFHNPKKITPLINPFNRRTIALSYDIAREKKRTRLKYAVFLI